MAGNGVLMVTKIVNLCLTVGVQLLCNIWIFYFAINLWLMRWTLRALSFDPLLLMLLVFVDVL
jgi:hypothetical protein